MDTAAFTSDSLTPSAVVEALAAAGFEVGPARPVRRTVLDTFDGRLHAAGLRLELRTGRAAVGAAGAAGGAGGQLVLGDARSSPAVTAVAAVPRLAADLPAGPMRNRLAPLLDVRALLPLATVTGAVREAVRRDGEGTARLVAEVHEAVAVEGRPGVEPAWVVGMWAGAGYAREAAAARALLRSLGLREHGGDAVDVVLAAAGVDRRGYRASPTVPLAPDDAAVDAFRQVLANLAEAVTANWQGTVADVDPEFLHDLRVAVRRTRSVLAQGRGVLPAGVRAAARESFAWLASETGEARDLDVYGIEWNRYVAPLGPEAAADLEPVRRHIASLRVDAHTAVAGVLRSKRYEGLMGGWLAWLSGPLPGEHRTGKDAGRRIGRVAGARILDAQARVLARGRAIDDGSPAEDLHDLRKDAKRLRYLLECFGGLYAPGPRKAFVRRLKDLQDNLGEHQDAEVHAARLRGMATDLPEGSREAATLVALGRLAESIDRARREARKTFTARFGAYDTKATARSLDDLLASSPPGTP